MKQKTDISVILPVHELNDTTKVLLNNAIQSVQQQVIQPDELVIVVPAASSELEYIKSLTFGDLNITIAENSGSVDFASQINYGVSVAKSNWVSILELDDEYAKIWFKNVIEYRNTYDGVGIFLPIIVDVDNSSQFVGFTNEAVWANSFSNELGFLDNDALLTYQNFNTDGMVIKKSLFEENGGFKSSIKLTFVYEFLLRMTFKTVKVMTIPRFGYKHVNQRPGSLFASYRDTINPVEAKWWLNQAKKEYYHIKDRNITYQQEQV